MRIAFLGKGGAGKTTTAAGFIRYLAAQRRMVLAVDADVNAHLRGALQLTDVEGEEHQLGDLCDEIFSYVRGDRNDLGERPFIGTMPPSLKSTFVRPTFDDAFIAKYAQKAANIGLLTVGTYKESDVGGSCYHTKLRGLAALFHHLLDTDDDVVVADTTAGTDNVATSLSFAYDINVFVVEPTEKSVRVYQDFLSVAPHLSDRLYVIANKVDGPEDVAFIERHVPRSKLLGCVPNSRHLKRFEQGERGALEYFQAEQNETFDRAFDMLKRTKRDWTEYLSLLRATHEKVCLDWYNDFYGQRLDANLDSEFTYQAALAQSGARAATCRNDRTSKMTAATLSASA